MASILQTLQSRYTTEDGDGSPLTVPVQVGVRQDSGLNPQQVGEATLATLDAYVLRRLQARAARIEGVANRLVGDYQWPFSPAHLAAAYPQQSAEERENTLRVQLETAADAVYQYVLGDLFGRAAPRDDRYAGQRNTYLGNPDDPNDIGEAGRTARDFYDMLGGAQQPGAIEIALKERELRTFKMTTPGRSQLTEKDPRYCPEYDYFADR